MIPSGKPYLVFSEGQLVKGGISPKFSSTSGFIYRILHSQHLTPHRFFVATRIDMAKKSQSIAV
jgi:hypothetical protein